jgi:phage terminase large subunit
MTALRIPTARVFTPLLEPARYKGAHGGRGSGKSHFFGDLWLEENVADKLDCVCLRETLKSLEFSVKKLLEGKIATHNAGSYFDVQDRRILTKQGGVTIFEGMQNHTADSIKSLEGFDRAWFEEAQNASDNSLTLLRPTIRKPLSQLWFGWNPKNETDAIDVFLRGVNPPDDSIVIQANYMDNPWLSDELRAEMEHDKRGMTLGTDAQRKAATAKFNWIWKGAYRTAGDALVFTNWRVEEFDTDEGATFRYGADWGFSIDPSVLVRCYLKGRQLFVDYEAYQVGCEIDRLPDLFMTVPQSEKWPLTADSARPETISYMRNHGFPRIGAAVKGAGSVEEGVAFLQGFEIIVHPRCVHTIDELSSYAYKLDPLTGKPIPVLEDKNNHVIDALRYASEGSRRAANAKPIPKAAPMPTTNHWGARR